MYTIEVEFEVYKQLTNRRATEQVSYNDVIRELLGLPQASQVRSAALNASPQPTDWVTKGVRFPAGTEFRASYKGQVRTGVVEGGALVVNGERYKSASAAAVAITGSPVNGWRFWECRMPGKLSWQLIEGLRRASI